MRAPMQEGRFPLPGQVRLLRRRDRRGRSGRAGRPHGVRAAPAPGRLRRAGRAPGPRARRPCRRGAPTLAANMETALNALWDSGAGPGDRIVVVGAGVVGLLVGSLAARLPGAEVTVVDVDLSRADVAQPSRLRRSQKPLDAPGDADVVFHASATAAGLASAIACAGLEATIVEMSWYGDKPVRAPLGRRLPQPPAEAGRRRRSAQVAPSRRPRWSHRRRLDKAARAARRRPPRRADHRGGRLRGCCRASCRGSSRPDAPGLATVMRYPIA